MSKSNAEIYDQYMKFLQTDSHPWVQPLVSFESKIENPFKRNEYPCPKNVGFPDSKIFYEKQNVMKISSKNQNKIGTEDSFSYSKLYSISLEEIETKIQFFEPITCTAFLYSRQTKSIISNVWNFYPKQSELFFDGIEVEQNATFNVDTFKTNFFCVFLNRAYPHSNASIDYYKDPTDEKFKIAKEEYEKASKNTKEFYPFAFTYTDFKAVSKAKTPYQLPSFQFLDTVPDEKQINLLISDILAKKLVPIPIGIKFKSIDKFCSPFIDQILLYRPEPFLEPFLNFQVIFQSIQVDESLKKYPLIIKLNIGDINDKDPKNIPNAIQSSSMSVLYNKYGTTNVIFPDKTGSITSAFQIKIPDDITRDYHLFLELFSIEDDKYVSQGKCSLSLFNESLFIKNSSVQLKFDCEKATVSLKTCLKSSLFLTSNDTKNFFETKDFETLNKIPKNELIEFMIPITDTFMNEISNKNEKAFEKFIEYCKLATSSYDQKQFVNYLMIYVSNFSFIDTSNAESFQNLLMTYLTDYLNKGSEAIEAITPYLFFFISLLIKSKKICNKDELSDVFIKFINTLAKINAQPNNYRYELFEVFGNYINMLFDIGCASFAVEAIKIQIESFPEANYLSNNLLDLIDITFKPRMFLFLIVYSHKFTQIVIDLLGKGFSSVTKSIRIFDVFLNLVKLYDQRFLEFIATTLLKVASLIKIDALKNNEKFISPIRVFLFLVTNTKSLQDNEQLIKGIHYIFNRMEIVYKPRLSQKANNTDSIQTMTLKNKTERVHRKTIVVRRGQYMTISPNNDDPEKNCLEEFELYNSVKGHFISLFTKCTNYNTLSPNKLACMLYHYMNVIGSNNYIKEIIGIFNLMMIKYKGKMFEIDMPPLAKILNKIFNYASRSTTVIENTCNLILSMLYIDFSENSNYNRSCVVFTRALYLLDTNIIKTGKFLKFLEHLSKATENNDVISICELFCKNFDLLTKNPITVEKTIELYYKRFKLFKDSPDSQFEILESLKKYLLSKSLNYEAIEVTLLQMALLLEYLVIIEKMPNYFSLLHNCLVFEKICSSYKDVFFPDEKLSDIPLIPMFCDSFYFNEKKFFELFEKVFNLCEANNFYSISLSLLDLCWPILDYWHSYSELSYVFGKYSNFISKMDTVITTNFEITQLRFFRVVLYIKQEVKIYIYCAKPLTSLFDFCDSFMSSYKKIYGDNKVESIGGSTLADPTKLDADKIYIQITYVEPYLKNHNPNSQLYNQFFFKVPFTKNQKVQGDIEEQYLRKSIMTTVSFLPGYSSRSKVIETTTKEYEPIQVAYKDLIKRIAEIENAINLKDFRKIQQLLCGSLLVQVNVGPSKIAEIFLNGNYNEKYKKKLRNAFIEFMRQNVLGVQLHGEWVESNPEFIPLQIQIEESLIDLKKKMLPYIQE